MKLVDTRGGEYLIEPHGPTLLSQVDGAACGLVRHTLHSPAFVIMSIGEIDRGLTERGIRGSYMGDLTIAGIPIVEEHDLEQIDRRITQMFGRRLPLSTEPAIPGMVPTPRILEELERRWARRWDPLPPSRDNPFGLSDGELERLGHTMRPQVVIDQALVSQHLEQLMAYHHHHYRTDADEIYRRHGGSQTPPSKRPPSKLHPLVQQDERDRALVESSEPPAAAPGGSAGPSSM